MRGLTLAQVRQLLKPVNRQRVLKDGKGHSHVSQQDVTAHLIRLFGFGNFDTDVYGPDLVFEDNVVDKQSGEINPFRWDVCYRAMVRLTIRDPEGNEICHYTDGSTGSALNQTRSDAHDLAMKASISLAKKRAAICLGDQFGLGLYNKGDLNALVRDTLVLPPDEASDVKPDEAVDVQDGVPQQVSLGNDEADYDGSEPNPDQSTSWHVPSEADAARAQLRVLLESRGVDPLDAVDRFAAAGYGSLRESTDVDGINELISFYRGHTPDAATEEVATE